jgi:hypothetical protein
MGQVLAKVQRALGVVAMVGLFAGCTTATQRHEDAFPRPRLSARCRFGQGTFAGTRATGKTRRNRPFRRSSRQLANPTLKSHSWPRSRLSSSRESGHPRQTADMSTAGSRQPVEQRLCLFEIGCVEALGEPAVNGGEKVARFGGPTLVAAEAGKARGGAQFPQLGLLLLGDAQGFAIQFLGIREMPWPQQQFTFVPIQFCREPALPYPFSDLQGSIR